MANYVSPEIGHMSWPDSLSFVAVEMKMSVQWQRRFNRGLHRLKEELPGVQTYGVYTGDRPAMVDDVHVLPVQDFLKDIWDGTIIRKPPTLGNQSYNPQSLHKY
jgi:hypothetical protein